MCAVMRSFGEYLKRSKLKMGLKTTALIVATLLLLFLPSSSQGNYGKSESDHVALENKSIKQSGQLLSTYDDYFSFAMFENFEACREVFLDELSLVRLLSGAIKTNLETKKKMLMSRRPSSSPSLDANFHTQVHNVTARFPSAEDFYGAQKGLIYLHDTYHFKLKLLSKGQIAADSYPLGRLLFDSRHGLRVEDYYGLTRQAFAFKWYDVAIDLLRAAFHLLSKIGQDSVDKKVLTHMTKMKKDLVVLNNQNLNRDGRAITGDYKTHPFLVSDNLLPKKTQPDFVREGTVITFDNRTRQGKDAHFRSVCRNALPSQRKTNSLQCHLLHHNQPFLRLGPFKIEVASLEPFISVIHDFLAEEEMRFLVDHSRPRLSRTRVKDPYNAEIEKGLRKAEKKTRIIHKSVQYWIKEIEYDRYYDNLHELEENDNYVVHFPNLLHISQRIELATGLNATAKYAATDYQTTNYGLGGLCETHYDPHGYIEGVELPPHPGFLRLKKQGDMVATVMGWLEDVEAGGATAFAAPEFETLVWPRRGSVAFWFNLDKKGHRDTRLLHGGCPVIKGSKWILNKWLYFFDQHKKIPCGLSDSEYIPPFNDYY